jgi:hypothetical protein
MLFIQGAAQVIISPVKMLLAPQNCILANSRNSIEKQILSTFTINSVPKVLAGHFPIREMKDRVQTVQLGLKFMNDVPRMLQKKRFLLYRTVVTQFFLPVCPPAHIPGSP